MRRNRILLTAALLLASFTACTGPGAAPGFIRVDAVAPLMRRVADRHDRLVTGELDQASIGTADQATYLRSTELLRGVLDEAQLGQSEQILPR